MINSVELSDDRIFLVEPHAAVRNAVSELLHAEGLAVETCTSLEQVLQRARRDRRELALVAWQSMDGLLADENHQHLKQVTGRVRLLLTVPRRWARMLSRAELGVDALVPKPFDADELLAALRQAAVSDRQPAPS